MNTPDLSRAAWRKSSRSNGNNGACVEVGIAQNFAGVRDTKDRGYGTLAFSRSTWSGFLTAIKTGRYDT
ncbi:DUF397 domain-containing protein [Saccharopolyspora cebuensis]|uniref:DUF397 domain-containing protein n=1 Tax=Saccharopolyspora cebuensis TaxID=418759 RepID=A0ABV4CKU0_9PSEU